VREGLKWEANLDQPRRRRDRSPVVMRRGEVDPQTGTALVKALLAKKSCIEASTIEQRLDDLEQHLKQDHVRTNWLRVVK
jgi:hypothetical protein